MKVKELQKPPHISKQHVHMGKRVTQKYYIYKEMKSGSVKHEIQKTLINFACCLYKYES